MTYMRLFVAEKFRALRIQCNRDLEINAIKKINTPAEKTIDNGRLYTLPASISIFYSEIPWDTIMQNVKRLAPLLTLPRVIHIPRGQIHSYPRSRL